MSCSFNNYLVFTETAIVGKAIPLPPPFLYLTPSAYAYSYISNNVSYPPHRIHICYPRPNPYPPPNPYVLNSPPISCHPTHIIHPIHIIHIQLHLYHIRQRGSKQSLKNLFTILESSTAP